LTRVNRSRGSPLLLSGRLSALTGSARSALGALGRSPEDKSRKAANNACYDCVGHDRGKGERGDDADEQDAQQVARRAVIDGGRLHLHAVRLQRQTKAIESIRSYVAIWFWLTIVGAVLFAIAINNS
jgi:hypothetical protein